MEVVAPVVARHQQYEFADIGRVVLGGFVEKPLDEARIDLVERQAVGDRFGEKGAHASCLNLRDPAGRLTVLEAWGRAEQHQAAHPLALVHRQLLAEIAAGRIADDMGAGAPQMIHQFADIPDQPLEGQRAIGGETVVADLKSSEPEREARAQ